MPTEPQLRPLRFGNFEVDLRSGELRKGGVKLKFGGQPFQVLSILLERPAEVVTREELQKRLWPDTFVDVDHNLNTAINKIREVLGDSAESPHFVETLPRRGYRFIGELELPVEPAVPAAAVEPDRGWHAYPMWLKIAAGVLAISVFVLGAWAVFRWYRPQRAKEQQAMTAVPFTALPGQAASPAFSPDGSRIAFAWNGDPGPGAQGFDLYVKALGSETLLRLTRHPSEWISPVWSPDGTQIAFHRMDGAGTGIYVVSALGGPERKLRSTRMRRNIFSPLKNFAVISWSPDGKWIAFADVAPEEEQTKISLLSMETMESKHIPIDPMCVSEGLPAFSHDGRYLAYWCFRNEYQAGVNSLPLPDGKPQMIAAIWGFPVGLTWSPDDEQLIYSLWSGNSNQLHQFTVANGSTKKLAFAGNDMQPAVSPKGDKLAYSSISFSSSIWRRDLLHPESPATELVRSSRAQFDAQYSPDGKRIVFASFRSGVHGVWMSNEDGSNLVQISNPAQTSGSPQWSPDGTKIVFDSLRRDRWEIYVTDVAEQKPRKLVTNISDTIRPRWSHDGKWIYFRSDEPGRTGIYRGPVSGGDAVLLSKEIDGVSQESPDGKTVYFATDSVKSILKKVALPAQPGTETEVGLPPLSASSLWTLSPGGIYLVPAEAPTSVRYFDFATRQIHTIFEVDKQLVSGLSLSPDGRWILYSQMGDASGDIMLVDHFH